MPKGARPSTQGFAVWLLRWFAVKVRVVAVMFVVFSLFPLYVGLSGPRGQGSGDLAIGAIVAGVGAILLLVAWPLARFARSRTEWPPRK
jgi:hypothetical protein